MTHHYNEDEEPSTPRDKARALQFERNKSARSADADSVNKYLQANTLVALFLSTEAGQDIERDLRAGHLSLKDAWKCIGYQSGAMDCLLEPKKDALVP